MDHEQSPPVQHTYGRSSGIFIAFSRRHCGHGSRTIFRSTDRKTVMESYKNGKKPFSYIARIIFWTIYILFLLLLGLFSAPYFCIFLFLYCTVFQV